VALRSFKDPGAFYKEAVRLYRQWKASRDLSEPVTEVEIESEEGINKSARITFEQAEEQAREEIEDYFASMNPYELQQLVADLLKAMGYYPSWISPPGRDGGLYRCVSRSFGYPPTADQSASQAANYCG